MARETSQVARRRSDPGGRLELQHDATPEELTHGWSYAIGPADLDGDLLPEIYVANDFGPDRLLHNRSTPGRFQFVALNGERAMSTPASCVINQDSFKGMGVDFGDINGGGLLDIYVEQPDVLVGPDREPAACAEHRPARAHETGDRSVPQTSEELGLSRNGWSWDCRPQRIWLATASWRRLQANGFVENRSTGWWRTAKPGRPATTNS